jgi:hypothetical protein
MDLVHLQQRTAKLPPSALAKSTKLQLTADDNWLNKDQSTTRK